MTSRHAESPIIESIAWGHMKVAGLGEGKDFKLWPGGGCAWDWSKTGTHHVPGIQPADVEELVERGAGTVVLSRGMLLRLQTAPETLEWLLKRGIVFHVLETREAVRDYNELASAGATVGGLFHSTC